MKSKIIPFPQDRVKEPHLIKTNDKNKIIYLSDKMKEKTK